MGEKSKLRRTISKWANADDMHARELRETTRKGDCNLIADCAGPRSRCACGARSRPSRCGRAAASPPSRPSCSTAPTRSCWSGSGRRRIAAISPGRSLEVEGRIGRHDGDRIIYNPRYELLP